NGNRDFDRFRFEPGFDRHQRAVKAAKPVADNREGGRDALGGLLLRLLLAGGEALAVRLRFAVRAPALMFDHRYRRLFAGGEVLVEQIFGCCFHCLTFSARPRTRAQPSAGPSTSSSGAGFPREPAPAKAGAGMNAVWFDCPNILRCLSR